MHLIYCIQKVKVASQNITWIYNNTTYWQVKKERKKERKKKEREDKSNKNKWEEITKEENTTTDNK